MSPDDRSCAHVRERMLEGDVWRRHLAVCDGCGSYAAALEAVDDGLLDPDPPNAVPPPGLCAGIMAEVIRLQQGHERRRLVGLCLGIMAAVGIAVTMALLARPEGGGMPVSGIAALVDSARATFATGAAGLSRLYQEAVRGSSVALALSASLLAAAMSLMVRWAATE